MEQTKEQITAPETAEDRDQELFAAIGRGRRRKKRRRIIILIVIAALIAGGLYAAVRYGRAKVNEQFGDMEPTNSVESYTVGSGSVTTTVSGSGLLEDADTEALKLPEGVKVDEVVVIVGERVEEGQVLATVEPSSVMSAMAATQKQLNDLDVQLRSAAANAVSIYLNTNVGGRVKIIYGQVGDEVAACMVEHGALAVLSLDGYMAVDLETDALAEGQEVKVLRADGKSIKGRVDRAFQGTATVLVTDNGPMFDEVVTVLDADGGEVGSGALYIHNPLRITGYAGTISRVSAAENKYFNAGYSLFTLKDTGYSANYEAILKDRREAEDTLVELLNIYQSGAVRAPFAGTVSSIEYKARTASVDGESDDNDDQNDDNGAGGEEGGEGGVKTDPRALLTLARDEKMTVTIAVDETDILSLQVGQSAQLTINSIGEVFTGEVTEINRKASASSGVTSYSAVISVPKDPRMLPGMSVRAVVRIQGVAGAILIPEEALHQSRDEAFVYTSCDPETGELGGAVSVVAGLSDGSMVEIVEGLSEGDTVYYIKEVDPWAYSYGFASDGDAAVWVDTGEGFASDGDAAGAEYEELEQYAAQDDGEAASEEAAP